MRSSRTQGSRQLPPPDTGTERVITLDQIRPHPRVQNEYVDGPRVPSTGSFKSHIHSGSLGSGHRAVVVLPSRPTSSSARSSVNSNFGLVTPIPISSQPVPITTPLKKDLVESAKVERDRDDEIICSKCGKCKCGSCTEPQGLPSKWVCGDSCQVSPDALVETCTCFCCIKGIFYHCGKDEQEGDYECYMDPCACCGKPHCCKRWTCMAVSALCLPCLCCYWPAWGVLKAGTLCYNKCRKKGCQCKSKKHTEYKHAGSQLRGLLIESDSSSA